MMDRTDLIIELSSLLISTGRKACIEKAAQLKNKALQDRSLSFRSLDLTAKELNTFALILSKDPKEAAHNLNSISLSYNPKIGDEGIISLFRQLPHQIQQIGLVGCGIGDIGGQAILEWMQKATALEMICMEGNRFSNALKIAFDNYKKTDPNIVIIY